MGRQDFAPIDYYGPWADRQRQLRAEEEAKPKYRIKIKKIPAGSAPITIRMSWFGLEMDATAVTPEQPQMDPLKNGKPVEPRFGFVVTKGAGIEALKKAKRNIAADYFTKFWPATGSFVFGANEVNFKKVEGQTTPSK